MKSGVITPGGRVPSFPQSGGPLPPGQIDRVDRNKIGARPFPIRPTPPRGGIVAFPDRFPPGRTNLPREEFFDQLGQGGAGQGFLTPFGETAPQRFRNQPDQIGGLGAQVFKDFQAKDPLSIYKDLVDPGNFGIEKQAFLDMSPFQQFMWSERARRKLGLKGHRRGPGRPPKRPRPSPFPRPLPYPDPRRLPPDRPNPFPMFGG